MKTKIFLLAALAATLAGLGSCSKDDDNGSGGSGNDPEGTIMIAVRNSDNGKTLVDVDGGVWFYIDSANNFASSITLGEFASVGPVGGLGGVRSIPDAGWSRKVGVMEGYGYVFRIGYIDAGGVPVTSYYVRIYVVDAIIGTNGGILGYNIKYQMPFEP